MLNRAPSSLPDICYMLYVTHVTPHTLSAWLQLWDAGKPSPYLAHLLDSKQLDVAGKRVLVPGCG